MALDPRRQIAAVEHLLRRLAEERFYGEVIVRIEGGNVMYTRVQQIRRIEDLAADAEQVNSPARKL